MTKIAVVGTGYVGLSNAVLLSQHNEVVALDIDESRVAMVNNRLSPIVDVELEDFLANRALNLRATTDKRDAYLGAEFVIVGNTYGLRSRHQCIQHRFGQSGGRRCRKD